VVGVSAALATLDILENQPILQTIASYGKVLTEGIDGILTEAGLPHHMTGLPSIFGFVLGREAEPHDFREYCSGDDSLYESLVYELIRHGVMPDADGREPWFMSYSHDEQIVDDTLNIFADAVIAIKP
jgi:glutamate-1-semialdehyde 2,1-aminomutase